MTPKEITTLAGHRLVPPWVMKLALDVAAAEREKQAKQEPMYISKYCVKSGCACHYSTAVDGEPVAVYTTPQTVSQEYQDHLVNQSFDWSAMAAKHQFMEGYRIGLAEMREKCATVSEQGTGEAVQKAALEILINERKRIATAIRAIKFEGDTGFRPVSEMIAEHKQDPKKGAAIEKAKMRKATRAEKIAMSGVYEVPVEQAEQEPVAWRWSESNGERWFDWRTDWTKHDEALRLGFKVEYAYAAPVRTKDLTDDEINKAWENIDYFKTYSQIRIDAARAVIAADREKNK